MIMPTATLPSELLVCGSFILRRPLLGTLGEVLINMGKLKNLEIDQMDMEVTERKQAN